MYYPGIDFQTSISIGTIYSIHYYEYRTDFTFSGETHDFWEFVYADKGYLDMMGRKLKKGKYPEKENEIAMDSYTLKNLGVEEKTGEQVALDGEIFTLSGILTEMPEKLPKQQGDFMQVFVNSTLDYGKNGTFLYLKFAEDGNVYKQVTAFANNFGIKVRNFTRNNGLSSYVGAEAPADILETIKTGLKYKEAGFPYIWEQLNGNGTLTDKVILAALALFSAFVIYSLFQISVSKRMSQYSVMQTAAPEHRPYPTLLPSYNDLNARRCTCGSDHYQKNCRPCRSHDINRTCLHTFGHPRTH